jgi:hypothetical protein
VHEPQKPIPGSTTNTSAQVPCQHEPAGQTGPEPLTCGRGVARLVARCLACRGGRLNDCRLRPESLEPYMGSYSYTRYVTSCPCCGERASELIKLNVLKQRLCGCMASSYILRTIEWCRFVSKIIGIDTIPPWWKYA